MLELPDHGGDGQELSVEGGIPGLGVRESTAEEGEQLKPPSMVLMEGVGGDGQGGVAARMYKKGSLGDGVLHLVDGSDHLRGDGEVLLGLGQGVRQGVGDVGKAGKETAIEIHMLNKRWTSSLEEGRGKGFLFGGGDERKFLSD